MLFFKSYIMLLYYELVFSHIYKEIRIGERKAKHFLNRPKRDLTEECDEWLGCYYEEAREYSLSAEEIYEFMTKFKCDQVCSGVPCFRANSEFDHIDSVKVACAEPTSKTTKMSSMATISDGRTFENTFMERKKQDKTTTLTTAISTTKDRTKSESTTIPADTIITTKSIKPELTSATAAALISAINTKRESHSYTAAAPVTAENTKTESTSTTAATFVTEESKQTELTPNTYINTKDSTKPQITTTTGTNITTKEVTKHATYATLVNTDMTKKGTQVEATVTATTYLNNMKRTKLGTTTSSATVQITQDITEPGPTKRHAAPRIITESRKQNTTTNLATVLNLTGSTIQIITSTLSETSMSKESTEMLTFIDNTEISMGVTSTGRTPQSTRSSNNLISCPCPCYAITVTQNKWLFLEGHNFTIPELKLILKKELEQIETTLKIDKRKTSLFKYSKISASDSKPTSRFIGFFAIILLFLPVVIMISVDIFNIFIKN